MQVEYQPGPTRAICAQLVADDEERRTDVPWRAASIARAIMADSASGKRDLLSSDSEPCHAIEFNQAQLDDVRALLADVKNGAGRAMARSINRTRDHVQSVVVKGVYSGSESYAGRHPAICAVGRQMQRRLICQSQVTAQGKRIPLYRFPWKDDHDCSQNSSFSPPQRLNIGGRWVTITRTKRRPVKIKVRRSSGAESWRHLFSVLYRGESAPDGARDQGAKRKPVFVPRGPSVGGVLDGRPGFLPETLQDAGAWLAKELDSAANYLLKKEGEPV